MKDPLLSDPRLRRFSGKTVLFPRASCGIGPSIACALARCGANVFVLEHRRSEAERVRSLLETQRIRASQTFRAVVVDLDDRDALEECVGIIVDQSVVHILINNSDSPAAEADVPNPAQRSDHATHAQFGQLAAVTNAVLSHFRERQSGWVINLARLDATAGYRAAMNFTARWITMTGFSSESRHRLKRLGVRISFAAISDSRNGDVAPSSSPLTARECGCVGGEWWLQKLATGRTHLVPGFPGKLVYHAARLFAAFHRPGGAHPAPAPAAQFRRFRRADKSHTQFTSPPLVQV